MGGIKKEKLSSAGDSEANSVSGEPSRPSGKKRVKKMVSFHSTIAEPAARDDEPVEQSPRASEPPRMSMTSVCSATGGRFEVLLVWRKVPRGYGGVRKTIASGNMLRRKTLALDSM